MIRRLVLQSLRHRPGRSLLLLAGYALGVGVTVALLSIGSALVQGSRDRTLVGGGDLTVIPAGLDLETFRTGGASSLYFSVDQAPYLYRQVLAGPRFRGRIAAAAPWIDDEVLYLELPDRDGGSGDGTEVRTADGARLHPVSAGGRIPSLARRLGAPARVTTGGWRDLPGDRRWAAPGDSALYASLDAFHLPPPEAAADSSWAEWHYFNALLPEDRGWLYLTYMVAGEVPDGRWGGRLLGTLVTREGDTYRTRQYAADLSAEEVRFSLVRPDLRIGGSTVALGPDGRYRIRAEIPPAAGGDGPRLRVELTLAGERRSYLPPLDAAPGAFPSGYVVPMLDARARGRVCVGDACRELDGTRAYHDHNWGTWSGVTWDWGQARAGPYRLLYGGVRRDGTPGGDAGAAGRRFLFLTDSLGFAGLFTIDRLEHRWRKVPGAETGAAPGAVPPGARRPEGLTVGAARGGDTMRLEVDVRHARATRRDGATVDGAGARLFWQMRGEARLEGRIRGRPAAAAGEGFFETWTPATDAVPGTYLER